MPNPFEAIKPNYSLTDPGQRVREGVKGYNNLIGGVSGMESAFSGLNDAGDIRSAFGITDPSELISAAFKGQKQNLGSARSNALARSSQRSGGSATPERSLFQSVEQSYSNALAGLLGQESEAQAGAQMQQEQLIASILGQAKQGQDQFGLNQAGVLGGLLGDVNQQNMQERQFLHETEGANWLDVAGGILKTLGPIAAGILFPPAGIAAGAAAGIGAAQGINSGQGQGGQYGFGTP